jgi:DNA-directed RNA polymerase II subunit RPB2
MLINKMWDEAISTFFKDGVSRFSEGQIEPFEDFLYNKIPLVLRSTPAIVVWHEQDEVTKKYKYEFRLSFDNVSYMKPRIQEATGRLKQMLPYEARVRNFTYAAQMFVDVKFTVRSYSGPNLSEFVEQTKTFEGISMGKIPVMLGSSLCVLKDFSTPITELGECNGDPFGYFIIHGSERIILSQEKVADNRNMVFTNKKSSSKFSHSVEMKSLHESFTMPPKKVEIRISSKFNGLGYPLNICIPRFREDIPLMVFFRALGVTSDKDVHDRIGDGADEYLAPSFKEAADINVFTQDDAIEYLTHHLQYPSLSEDKHAHIRGLLLSEFLPHVNLAQEENTVEVTNARKILILVSMMKKLISTARSQTRLDDRDAYPNKRVVTTGALLTHLFRQLFQKVCKDIRSKLVHEINNDNWKRAGKPLDALSISNLYKILKVSSIEGKMKQALATGNFTVQGLGTSNSTALSNATKSGVSQVLNRMSYCATLSHVRRIQTPVEKSGKLLAPRKLHGTSWGFVCPVETPEGHSVGIVKTMSLMTTVSGHVPSFVVTNLLKDIKSVRWVSDITSTGEVSIVVNGVIIAHTEDPINVYKILKDAKTSCRIHPHISIAWNVIGKAIIVETDAGRLVRPVFRVRNGKLMDAPEDKSNWNSWISTCVEYIDPSESDVVKIAMMPEDITPLHTHCEIHPQMILGHMAATIPLSDHNQSPRNTYQSAMGKQAMSIYATNYQKRLDKNAYIICSPQRPLVETRITRILGMPKMPFGENAIVAIACYSGYNQEDSVILNRNSLKRGFMRGLYYTMYKDEEHRNVASGREERFARARQESTRGYKNTSYHAIHDNGIPQKNAIIQENDVVIGKVVNLRNDPHGYLYKDLSTTHKSAEACRVDGVWQDKNSDGYPFVKVRVCSERFPTIGDKFSSRHGQKGTVGMIMDECDMPFTSSGLRPDIIMNPHAVPSRMTIAQLLETLYGRIGTRKGTIGDGTPYSHLKMEELTKQMEELGLHPYGNEIMYNGMTGEMMEVEIFVGSTFYQRLKHMVIDKQHSRSRGPIVSLTRQPCEGRARDGGLRVGEMERDCMLTHGASMFTKERLMDVSDPFETGICRGCGSLATMNDIDGLYECKSCNSKVGFEKKTIPYAVKLWLQELEAMHISPRMFLGKE